MSKFNKGDKARFVEYDKKWLYDIKEDKLYKIIDDKEYEPCKFGIVQLSKFCPYAEITNTYHINPYKFRNEMEIENEYYKGEDEKAYN